MMNVSRINPHKFYNQRYITTSKITTIKKPSYVSSKIKRSQTNSLSNDVVTLSYFVGKGIIAFTFFYTSLNYFHYKRLREEYEENDEDNKKSK